MASESLSVILTGKGGELTGKGGELVSEFRKIGAEAQKTFRQVRGVGKAALLGIGGATVAAGVVAVKLGADFPTVNDPARAGVVSAQRCRTRRRTDRIPSVVRPAAGRLGVTCP